MPVRGQEVLHRLRQGEFNVHLATVGQHHDEKGQPPPAVADRDGARVAPVHLGQFPRGEGQGEEGFPRPGADAADVVLDDAHVSRIPRRAQALVDLLGAQRLGIQPADDAALEGIELAGPGWGAAPGIGPIQPEAHGLDVQPQLTRELRRGEVLRGAVADGAPGGVVDHGRPPSAARRRPRRSPGATGAGRLSTW